MAQVGQLLLRHPVHAVEQVQEQSALLPAVAGEQRDWPHENVPSSPSPIPGSDFADVEELLAGRGTADCAV
jgi:hypothetical protein